MIKVHGKRVCNSTMIVEDEIRWELLALFFKQGFVTYFPQIV